MFLWCPMLSWTGAPAVAPGSPRLFAPQLPRAVARAVALFGHLHSELQSPRDGQGLGFRGFRGPWNPWLGITVGGKAYENAGKSRHPSLTCSTNWDSRSGKIGGFMTLGEWHPENNHNAPYVVDKKFHDESDELLNHNKTHSLIVISINSITPVQLLNDG